MTAPGGHKHPAILVQKANYIPDFHRNIPVHGLLLDSRQTRDQPIFLRIMTLAPDSRDWATLEHVRRCGKVDLWLLFPLSAVLRMTPTDGVMPEWKHTLDRLLGSNDWEQALYKPVEAAPMDDLLDTPTSSEPATHRLNTRELQQWVSGRLKQMFPFVAEPYLLKSRKSPLFLFYFAVSNTNPKAQQLAQRAASHIIRKQTGSN